MLRLRDEGIELPAAAVVCFALDRLVLTCESFRFNGAIGDTSQTDLYRWPRPGHPRCIAALRRSDRPSPTVILVGGDDALRIADKMRAAGCHAEIELWSHIWHDWPMYMRVMRETKAAIARVAKFMQDKL